MMASQQITVQETIGSRVNFLIRSNKRNINELATAIGLSGQGLRDILSGKSKNPKADVVASLAKHLHVSTDWLLTGAERNPAAIQPVFDPSQGSYLQRAPQHTTLPGQTTPYVPAKALASFLSHGGNVAKVEDVQFFTLPGGMSIKGEVVGFEAEGDSMYPDIKSGSLIICTAETGEMRYLQSGSFYAILYAGHFSIRKLINHVESDGNIELQPSNPTFAPIRVRMEDVKKIWRVQLLIQWV